MGTPRDAGEMSDVIAASLAVDFDQFYVATGHRSLALAVALTGNWAEAEDLVQDAYVAAHRRWATVSRYEDPAGWVRRVIVNRSASRWRRVGREARALARLASRHEQIDDGVMPDHEFWDSVRALPDRQRAAVALFYVADLPVAAVADQLGCSEGAVKVHLSRARASLHASMTQRTEGGQ